MKLYESIVNNLKETETIGDLLEEIDNAYDIGTIESIGKRFKNEMDRKTIEDEVTAIEEEYGDVYSMDEDSDEYASILDELKSCIASDFSGEEENMNEAENINWKEEEKKLLSDITSVDTTALKEFYKRFVEQGKDRFAEKIKKELDNRDIKEEEEIKEGTLEPRYSTRKSFYGKANVNDNDNTLVSYGTPIMKINDGKIEMLCRPEHLTQTTIRHIREFMQQNGMDPLPKNKLIKMIEEQGNINEAEDIPNPTYGDDIDKIMSRVHGSKIDKALQKLVDDNKLGSFDINRNANGDLEVVLSYPVYDVPGTDRPVFPKEDSVEALYDAIIKSRDELEDDFYGALQNANDFYGYDNEEQLNERIKEEKAVLTKLAEDLNLIKDEVNMNESVTINGVNYYRVLDESGEEYYSIDPESITTNITETEEPAKQNKIPRNWKKIYGEMVGQSSAGKAGDKFEITKDEYDRPIMKYEDGKEYQANWSMIRSPEMVKITNVELNETEDLKESSNIIWSSEITEDNFDDAVIKENYDDYVANFDTTFKPMSYEEFLDSDWLYNFLQTAFENQEDYDEWSDYITNYPENSLKEYYQEYLDENKDTKEEPISYESYKEDYINDNSGDEWDYLQEDFLENICPMIDKQVNNDILIVSGDYHSNYPDFRPSGAGGKLLNKAEDILDWLSNEDRVDILNNDGIVGVAAYDHDGSIGGNLYTLPDDKELLYEIAKKTDYYDEDRDMEDVLGEFSYDLNHGNIDMSDLRDYADKFVPIKLEW